MNSCIHCIRSIVLNSHLQPMGSRRPWPAGDRGNAGLLAPAPESAHQKSFKNDARPGRASGEQSLHVIGKKHQHAQELNSCETGSGRKSHGHPSRFERFTKCALYRLHQIVQYILHQIASDAVCVDGNLRGLQRIAVRVDCSLRALQSAWTAVQSAWNTCGYIWSMGVEFLWILCS